MPAWAHRATHSAGVWGAKTKFTLTWTRLRLRICCEARNAKADWNHDPGSIPAAISGGECTSYENRRLVSCPASGAVATFEGVGCARRRLRQRDSRKISAPLHHARLPQPQRGWRTASELRRPVLHSRWPCDVDDRRRGCRSENDCAGRDSRNFSKRRDATGTEEIGRASRRE